MSEQSQVIHERVDSLPVIIALGKRLGMVEALDDCLGSHGNHQVLSYGQLALGWLAYILSENDHRKSAVESWADKKRRVLKSLLGCEVRPRGSSTTTGWADSWSASPIRSDGRRSRSGCGGSAPWSSIWAASASGSTVRRAAATTREPMTA